MALQHSAKWHMA